MFIKIEDTPNPETLKFIPDDKLKIEKSVFIKKNEDVLPWKDFNKNMAISVEYNLEY